MTSVDETAGQEGRSYSGGCLCGGVRWTAEGPLRNISDCHCEHCRRFTGHHMAATATDIAYMSFIETDTLTWYQSQTDVQYGFCRECGSSLLWRTTDEPWRLSITAGSIDQSPEEPTGLSTDTALFVAEHGDYHDQQPVQTSLPGDRT